MRDTILTTRSILVAANAPGGRTSSAVAELALERFLRPFERFASSEASGGLVLMACTVVALVWANSPWAGAYEALWETPAGVAFGGADLVMSLRHWINDGLMVVFFFLVGLEIKREFLVGELADRRSAALPIAAALGGMIVPAAIYALWNAGGIGARGWGVPMATDIAFALGVLALLGPRVPLALKVFLAALAIADDIGAVLVIAVFYTAEIHLAALLVAAASVALAILLNVAGVRRPGAYAAVGLVLWLAVHASGIHATIAGVLLALTIPSRTRIDEDEFVRESRRMIDDFDAAGGPETSVLTNASQQDAVAELEAACERVQTPLMRLEHALHAPVSFVIMPLFALANAGLSFAGARPDAQTLPIAAGVLTGLLIGKPIGITLFAWGAVRLGLAARPAGVSWFALHGVSWLGGIGFTMALFVASLAFDTPRALDAAKLGVFAASVLAGLVGWWLVRRGTRA